jgi:N-acetylglucosaminyl-diphospho-decaprenol L-rhamnosyltransferase
VTSGTRFSAPSHSREEATDDQWPTSHVDVVVVSFNSRGQVRRCVEDLVGAGGIDVFVVDNASDDRCLETLDGLDVHTVARPTNGGFAVACNEGWRLGSAPFVLFLNPDARIERESLRHLVDVLDSDTAAGAVAPRIIRDDDSLDFSLRRFPRLRSTYARALFLHRLFPKAAWSDEIIRGESAYRRRATADWASGACLLVRRSTLDALGGFDESFFMYCEDTDLCRRLWEAGLKLTYVPEAVARHTGGASTERRSMPPTLVDSRIRYARKHGGDVVAVVERVGLAIEALLRLVIRAHDREARRGHLSALRVAIGRGGAGPRASVPMAGRASAERG